MAGVASCSNPSKKTIVDLSFFKIAWIDDVDKPHGPDCFNPNRGLRLPCLVVERANFNASSQIEVVTKKEAYTFPLEEFEGDIRVQNKEWRRFVVENFVQLGDFIYFDYLGDNTWYAKVLGLTACVKEVPNEVHWAKNLNTGGSTSGHASSSSRPRITLKPLGGGRQFNVTVPPSGGYDYYNPDVITLTIPAWAYRQFRLRSVTAVRLTHKILGNPTTVAVKWCRRGEQDGSLKFGVGWPAFAKANKIKCGDVLRFKITGMVDDVVSMLVKVVDSVTL